MGYYQNGLEFSSSSNVGQVFARWVYEWCTQVVGLTALDESSSTWTDIIASGLNGEIPAGENDIVEIPSGYSFSSSDAGRYLTLTNMTDLVGPPSTSRDGVYRILYAIDSTHVKVDIRNGVHHLGLLAGDSSISWRLWDSTSSYYPPTNAWAVLRGSYSTSPAEPNWDVQLQIPASGYRGFPEVAIGPYGTWDAGAHAWGDGRNTSLKHTGGDFGSAAQIYFWAYGDEYSFVACISEPQNKRSSLLYFGETNAFYPSIDTNPSVIINGTQFSSSQAPFGNGATMSADKIATSIMGLGYDDSTTVTYYASFPHFISNNKIATYARRWSQFSSSLYRINIMLECRTSLFMENRSILKNLWMTGIQNQGCLTFGTNNEYLHYWGGLVIPWNGSEINRHQFALGE